MGFSELLMGWRNKTVSRAAAQRRRGHSKVSVAPLRRCVRILLFTLFLSTIPSAAQPRMSMRPADVVKVANVADAQISPNGQWVVYTVSSVDEDHVPRERSRIHHDLQDECRRRPRQSLLTI